MISIFLLIGIPIIAHYWDKLEQPDLRIYLIVAFILVFIAAYKLQARIDTLLDDAPNLLVKRASHKEGVRLRDVTHGKIYGLATFYHLRIVNEPKGRLARQTARKVAGTVTILLESGQEVCAGKLHRWEHSPGPAFAGKAADLKEPTDIPPSGIEVLLDIAMKYEEDECFYTPTNETAATYGDFRDPRYRFPPGTYIAVVRLAGENVDTILRCQIVNKGKNEKLQIVPLNSEKRV